MDIQQLEAFEMWIRKQVMKLSWTELQSNEVLDTVDENTGLINSIWQKQKNWLRHVLRGDSVLRTVLEGRMEWTRRRGGQSTRMLDWMNSNDEEYQHKE